MAVSPIQDPDGSAEWLSRAAAELRAEEDPRWTVLGERVVEAAKAAARRSHPVAGTYPDGGAGLRVSDLVVRSQVRRALALVPGVRPLSVKAELAGQVLVRLAVEIAVDYGLELEATGEAARVAARAELDAVLGADRPGAPTCVVDVVVTDVTP